MTKKQREALDALIVKLMTDGYDDHDSALAKDGETYNWSVDGSDIKRLTQYVNAAMGCKMYDEDTWFYNEPSIRNRIKKLEEANIVKRSGSAGWGKSYRYYLVTEEEKKAAKERKKLRRKMEALEKKLQTKLMNTGVEVHKSRYIGFNISLGNDYELLEKVVNVILESA